MPRKELSNFHREPFLFASASPGAYLKTVVRLGTQRRHPPVSTCHCTTSSIPDTEALPMRSSSIWFFNVQSRRWKRQVGKLGAEEVPSHNQVSLTHNSFRRASTALAMGRCVS
jgi:hypothetical protein